MRGLLVTATDTGVGKTLVSAALIAWARGLGLEVGGMKPAESGCVRSSGGELIPADAAILQRAAGGGDPLELVCPFRMEAALAPGIAAELEGVPVSLEEIAKAHAALRNRNPEGVVVEGAGGLLVPMDSGFHTVRDLAARLELPVVIVSRAGLGTINHTALTVEALRSRGLECKGVILNAQGEGEYAAALGNSLAIERLCGVEILAILPPMGVSGTWERVLQATRWFGEHFGGRKLDPRDLLA